MFGRRAGMGAAEYLDSLARCPGRRRATRTWPPHGTEALAPLERSGGENPYTVHSEVQQTMSDLVGIIGARKRISRRR